MLHAAVLTTHHSLTTPGRFRWPRGGRQVNCCDSSGYCGRQAPPRGHATQPLLHIGVRGEVAAVCGVIQPTGISPILSNLTLIRGNRPDFSDHDEHNTNRPLSACSTNNKAQGTDKWEIHTGNFLFDQASPDKTTERIEPHHSLQGPVVATRLV